MREALTLLWLLPHPCQSLGVVPGNVFTRRLDPPAAVRPRPLQHLQVPAFSGEVSCRRTPRAVVLPRQLQHHQVPAMSGALHVPSSQVHPCSRAHRSAARCPPRAASAHVHATHGHPFAFAQASRSADPKKSPTLKTRRPATPLLVVTAHAGRPKGKMDLGYTTSRNALPARASEARAVGSSRSSTTLRKRSGNLSSRSSSGEISWSWALSLSSSSPLAGSESAGGAGLGPPPGGGSTLTLQTARGGAGRARESGAVCTRAVGAALVVAGFCGPARQGVPSCPVV